MTTATLQAFADSDIPHSPELDAELARLRLSKKETATVEILTALSMIEHRVSIYFKSLASRQGGAAGFYEAIANDILADTATIRAACCPVGRDML